MLRHAVTLLIVLVGWVFFRAETFGEACRYVGNMFGVTGHVASVTPIDYYLDRHAMLVMLAAVVLAMPVARQLVHVKRLLPAIAVDVWLLVLFLCSWATIAASTYNPFIYFRF